MDEKVIVQIHKGGPVIINGSVEITDENGKVYPTNGFTMLCRCGLTKDAPYCDNAHLESNFEK